ncbi:MAG: acyl-CoA dehydrogenase [Hyphomicrobiaceae bacterium]
MTHLQQSKFANLTQLLRNQRSSEDRQRIAKAIALLRSKGLLSRPFVEAASLPAPTAPPLFYLLVALGRGDLSVARLYEGHVNAMQLLARLGTRDQLDRAMQAASKDGMLGVWGADDPAQPARLLQRANSWRLSGRKTFASGADLIACPLIAAKTLDMKTQLLLLDRDSLGGRFDAGWWAPMGMQATNSYALNLDGLEGEAAQLVGKPGMYEAQPFFGAGAIRFVAAQLGGTLALWDATREHLVASDRYQNPHQAARLGQMLGELEAAYALVRSGYARIARSIAWSEASAGHPDDCLIADCARVGLEAIAERVTTLAIRCVGCAGLMDAHPLAAAARDLLVYLRQPGPDAAQTRVGIGACDGRYEALFDASEL